MKKLLLTLYILSLFFGCNTEDSVGFSPDSASPPQVRYFNNSSDINLKYGIKFGTAEYIGELSPDEITDYLNTVPGSHSVKGLDDSGLWHTSSSETFAAEYGKKYTLSLEGEYILSYWFLTEETSSSE